MKAMKAVVPHVEIPPYPELPPKYVPSDFHLTLIFLKDYQLHESWIMRELKAILSSSSLAVDHQRQVMKRTQARGILGTNGQTFTVVGDRNLVLGVYCVPDTSDKWVEPAMKEIVERHRAA